MEAVVAAFNKEKALVGAFSVIVKTDCGTDGSLYSTSLNRPAAARRAPAEAARCADLLAAVEEENTLEVHLDIDIIMVLLYILNMGLSVTFDIIIVL